MTKFYMPYINYHHSDLMWSIKEEVDSFIVKLLEHGFPAANLSFFQVKDSRGVMIDTDNTNLSVEDKMLSHNGVVLVSKNDSMVHFLNEGHLDTLAATDLSSTPAASTAAPDYSATPAATATTSDRNSTNLLYIKKLKEMFSELATASDNYGKPSPSGCDFVLTVPSYRMAIAICDAFKPAAVRVGTKYPDATIEFNVQGVDESKILLPQKAEEDYIKIFDILKNGIFTDNIYSISDDPAYEIAIAERTIIDVS